MSNIRVDVVGVDEFNARSSNDLFAPLQFTVSSSISDKNLNGISAPNSQYQNIVEKDVEMENTLMF